MRAPAVLLALIAAGALGCGGSHGAPRGDTARLTPSGTSTAPVTTPAPAPATPQGPVEGFGGQVRQRTELRASPGGRVLRTIGTKTDMRGPQILAIVARRGNWYGVLHPSLPNGRAGWIPTDAVQVLRETWSIVVDRSARRLQVFHDGKVVDAFPVAVGRPGSPTPVGRFAVTDRLAPAGGSPYGCCILALSARQPNLPRGWTGGDRIAMHGTETGVVGGAYSAGCIRIRTPDLRRLMDRIPVGTRVTVRE